MLNNEQLATLVQVARLYYVDNLSQREIAERLGVSRSLIALYLQRARELNIVSIEINAPHDFGMHLAEELRECAGLMHVSAIPQGLTPDLTRHAVAAAAAAHLPSLLQNGDVLGFGWGRTTSNMVELLEPKYPLNVRVVAMLGESSHVVSYSQMNELVQQAANRLGGKPAFLLAPMLVDAPQLRDLLLEENSIAKIVDMWDELTVACFGVGAIPSTPGMIAYIGESNIAELERLGAVGDICVHPFSRQGEFIDNPLRDRLIGVRMDQLREAKRRIAVACEPEKAIATAAALKSGIITDLFVDMPLAEAILHEFKS